MIINPFATTTTSFLNSEAFGKINPILEILRNQTHFLGRN